MKPASLRPRAEQDLIDAAGYYTDEGGLQLGERFFAAAMAVLASIRRRPKMGSPRLGELAGVPALRSWRVPGFPVRWLYFDLDDRIDLVRLLGERQDIVSILSRDA